MKAGSGAAREGEGSTTRSSAVALALTVALVLGFALLPRAFRGRGGAIVGAPAPDFTLALVANGSAVGSGASTLHLSDLRGRAVLLDFWATWCEPCRIQAPIVDQVARRWGDRGLVAVGVNTDTPDQGDPHAFAVARNLSYPIVHDTAGEAAHAYRVEDLPTLVVISRVGKVIAVRTGLTDDDELERLVRQAL